tara:strand:- start:113 stop:352 length:240 start_codon:yes stop_codon:yes gene_type:complete
MLQTNNNNQKGARMFEVFKVNLDGSLSNKEHLNDVDEVNTWIANKYGKYATIKIIKDASKFILMTDTGRWFEEIERGIA